MKEGKHIEKASINKIQILFMLIFTLGSLYICHDFYNNYKEEQINKKAADKFYEKEENKIVTEKSKQVEKLQNENSDIIGWIEIPGTSINYPVLQADDNSYYLTHNYKKEDSENGSIFLDKNFDMEKPSTNYLIYGHRNKYGQMFEELENYKKEEFYKEHSALQFTTLKESAEYEIIAVFLSRVYNKNEINVFRYYYFIDANNEEEFYNYIDKSKEASLYKIEKTAKYGDQLLTLSTCEYSRKDGRLVIVAKKIAII